MGRPILEPPQGARRLMGAQGQSGTCLESQRNPFSRVRQKSFNICGRPGESLRKHCVGLDRASMGSL